MFTLSHPRIDSLIQSHSPADTLLETFPTSFSPERKYLGASAACNRHQIDHLSSNVYMHCVVVECSAPHAVEYWTRQGCRVKACETGYTLTNGECNINPCHGFHCGVHGNCDIVSANAKCSCQGTWTGDHCETGCQSHRLMCKHSIARAYWGYGALPSVLVTIHTYNPHFLGRSPK